MKKPVKLFTLLLGVYLALIILLFLGTALAASDFAAGFLYENKHHRLEQAADSIVKIAAENDMSNLQSLAHLQDVIDAAGDVAGARIYLIESQRLSSVVSYKSSAERGIDAWLLADAKSLLAGKSVYHNNTFSDKFSERISFVGKPVKNGGNVVAVVLVFSPLTDVEDALGVVRIFIWCMAGIACIIGGLATLLVSRRVVRPLMELKRSAEAMAEGEYGDNIVQHNGTEETILLMGAFNIMRARVRDAEEKRRQLIADVSHELRTPLMTIRGFLMAVLDGTAEGEQIKKSLQRAYSETERMGRLTEGLLRLARLQSGSEQFKLENICVLNLLNEISEAFSFETESKGLTIEVSCQPGLELKGDRDQWIRIFTNLVSNAVNYSDKPGQINIDARKNDDEIIISVSDEGIGMPAEELPKIFDKFHRVDKSRSQQTPGTGLGLSIVSELLKLNMAGIEVVSELGKGSCFTVRIPEMSIRNEEI